MSKKLDIIDVIVELKKRFPHVELIVEEVEKPIGRDYYTFYKFFIKKLSGNTFEPPVKTSISLVKGNEIDTDDFFRIEKIMDESFRRTKLLGLI